MNSTLFSFLVLALFLIDTGCTTTAYWADVQGSPFNSSESKTRSYYLKAEEIVWDYAPDGYNVLTGKPWTPEEEIFTNNSAHSGSKYLRCLIREYVDQNFTNVKKRSEEDGYLGFLAPLISAEVGDTIEVLLNNQCRFNISLHPHGVFYTKANEGDHYSDGTSGADRLDDSISPNSTYLYTWFVPERAGPPAIENTSSTSWLYHSSIGGGLEDIIGPIGFISIMARGFFNETNVATPTDLDRQVFFIFGMVDENMSPYINYNLEEYSPSSLSHPQQNDMEMEMTMGSQESNKLYSINGYIYGNGPLLNIKQGTRVRWVVASGEGAHAPHWHGNVLTSDKKRVDVLNLGPMQVINADMVPDDGGKWVFHCHYMDHMNYGMITMYNVL